MSATTTPGELWTPATPEQHERALASVRSLVREQSYVAGAWCDADSGRAFPVTDPATGAVLAHVPAMGATETRRAIEAAAAAFGPWRSRPAGERAQVLRRWSDLMHERIDDLATLITLEQGKPLAEARGEIAYAASFLEWFGEEAKRVYGDTIPSPSADSRIVVLKQPIGVAAGITPWNFPAAMVTRKAGPALAVGCPIVVKPAAQTPLTALALAVLAEEAGLPAGLFSVITTDVAGAPAVGDEMTSNHVVRKLSFTGSTQVGKLLARQCADDVKRASLELGGNAPFIVFDDADLDAAVEGLLVAKFRNSGQTCIAANRVLVHDAVHDDFVARFAAAVETLGVGSGLADGTTIGPLIDDAAVEKVGAHVADALDHGAELVVGGGRSDRFVDPVLLTGVTTAMALAHEETFGPVAAVQRFGSDAEAITLANDTPFGLVAYLFSRDLARVWRTSESLESGMVGVNTGFVSTEVAPFGGVKHSGTGREGSRYGIDDWIELKYLALGGIGAS